MHAYTGIEKIDRLFNATQTKRTNEHGNRILEVHHDGDRYLFDFAPGFLDEWIQFDTDQDAWYFGTWVNKTKRLVLSYCEGDVSVVICEDDEHFDAEVASMCRFYTAAPAFKAIDADGTVTHFYQDQLEYFIDPERGKAFVIRFSSESDEGRSSVEP